MATRPPAPAAPLTRLQQIQKRAKELVSSAAALVETQAVKAAKATHEGLQAVDEKLQITQSAAEAGSKLAAAAAELDGQFGLTDKLLEARKTTEVAWQKSTVAATSLAQSTGLDKAVEHYLLEPGKKASDAISSNDAFKQAKALGEDAYGLVRTSARDLVNPSLPTLDQDALLEATQQELAYLAACLMQISAAESRTLGAQFGRAVFAKATGAAAVTSVLALVTAFGTSGTGTAIAALHGAALSSASLAWVGGLVGGGMAAGTVLTGGVGMVVGLGAYKVLASERRPFESLSDLEQSIVQSCWALGAICSEYQKQPAALDLPAVVQLLEGALRPLHQRVSGNLDVLCDQLDGKNAVALRQHALPDFKSAVLDRFGMYVAWLHSDEGTAWLSQAAAKDLPAADALRSAATARSVPGNAGQDAAGRQDIRAMYSIGGVFAALLSRKPLDDGLESRLVLEAIRRSTLALHDASEAEIGDYLRGLSQAQLRGFATNVKGIYHELRFVHDYNAEHTDTYARLHARTNHPGSDVQIVDAQTGRVIEEVQLKAVSSTGPVYAHFERYPDIPVRVTNEVAGEVHDARVAASGYENGDLRNDVEHVDQVLHDHTVVNRAEHAALVAAGVGTIDEVIQMMRGQRQFPDAVRQAATKAGVAAAATAMAALLFG